MSCGADGQPGTGTARGAGEEGIEVTGIDDLSSLSFVARLPVDATSATTARHLVSQFLRTRIEPTDEQLADAALVVHELVINGVLHGAPDEENRIVVSGQIANGQLVISVLDCGTAGTVAAQPFTDHRTNGRGLAMVSVLSSTWTVDRSAGTRVSAWLPL
jgi:anti-sigma regulatory factor (Ser/Thr protein kinase)